jgi:hypothetical protein
MSKRTKQMEYNMHDANVFCPIVTVRFWKINISVLVASKKCFLFIKDLRRCYRERRRPGNQAKVTRMFGRKLQETSTSEAWMRQPPKEGLILASLFLSLIPPRSPFPSTRRDHVYKGLVYNLHHQTQPLVVVCHSCLRSYTLVATSS